MAVRALGQSRDFDQRSLLEPLASFVNQPRTQLRCWKKPRERWGKSERPTPQTGCSCCYHRFSRRTSSWRRHRHWHSFSIRAGSATLKQLFADGDALTKVP